MQSPDARLRLRLAWERMSLSVFIVHSRPRCQQTGFNRKQPPMKMQFVFLAFSAWVAAGKADKASGPPQLIDRDIIFGNPEIAAAQLSPDGKYIAFLKPWKDTSAASHRTPRASPSESCPVSAPAAFRPVRLAGSTNSSDLPGPTRSSASVEKTSCSASLPRC